MFPRLMSVALTPPYMHVNKIRWEVGLEPFIGQDEIFRESAIVRWPSFILLYHDVLVCRW